MKYAVLLLGAFAGASAFGADIRGEVDAIYPQMQALYRDLHEHPELSTLETETAGRLAARLKELGYVVTTGVGGTGIVGVLKNGPGPTVALRVELDALPVVENTGLPFASKVRTKDASGAEVGVKKNSRRHTSVQWTPAAVRDCHELSAGDGERCGGEE